MLDTNNNSIADIINAQGDSRYVIICEHASKHIPDSYQNLGLSDAQVSRHIGWDIGAQDVALHLSTLLNAPLILQTRSRLLYDCNRPPSEASAIPQRSEATDIPGNLNLTAAQTDARAQDIYYPFHNSVRQLLDNRQNDIDSIIVTIHSFNPIYNGKERHLDIGLINDLDPSWAHTLTSAAQQMSDLVFRQNEPYSAADGVVHTLELHGRNRSLPNVMIEIKNNLIESGSEQLKIASLLARLLQENAP
ncbi:MAG: N-formylglutamate amidohydrolase [Oceanospirillaceae bacterium]